MNEKFGIISFLSHSGTNTSSSVVNQYYNDTEEVERKSQLIKLFCFVLLVTLVSGVPVYLALFLATAQYTALLGLPVCLLVVLLCFFSYRLNRVGHLETSSYLLIFGFSTLVLFDYWLLGATSALNIGLFIPIGLTMALMRFRQVIFTTLLVTILGCSFYLAQVVFKLYAPPLNVTESVQIIANLGSFWLGIPVCVALLVLPSRSQFKIIRAQNFRLQKMLAELAVRQQTGQLVSQQVLNLASQLDGNARQWVQGSQRQAVVSTQTSTAVRELSSTAESITLLAERISGEAELMAIHSQKIEETTHHSSVRNEAGLRAVNATNLISTEVVQLYQTLMQSLSELKTSTANSRLILGLINNIASETHLLSLNAAIEAAGAGEYGERFRVVAQEVKNLANQSSSASQQVVAILSAIDSATQHSLEVVRQGQERTQELSMISYQTGKVFTELSELIELARGQSVTIRQAAGEVQEISFTIKSATFQQLSASREVLELLNGLSNVAQESAEGSEEVSDSAQKLNELSRELNQALAA